MRYVLEGSVQRDQNRVRVNAQLIDGETGAHLWADRFQEDVADLFKLQDDVVARLANALSHELIRAEAKAATRSKNPNSIDLVMRGRAAITPVGATAADQGRARRGASLVRASARDRPEGCRCIGRFGAHLYGRICIWTDQSRNRLRRKNTRSGRPVHRARARQCLGLQRQKHLFEHFASTERRAPRRQRRARP